jgi:metal-dependent amidase/aminoacylase/carboxypeptidase family protein
MTMKVTGPAAVCAGLLLLAACGPTAEEQRAMDQQTCAGYGFAPGSEAMANCMMKTSQQRQAQQSADQRAAADRAAADQRARAQQDAIDQDNWDRKTGQGKYANPSSSSASTDMPDLSKMNCTSSSTTTGSANDQTTTTNTSCHN